MKTKTNRCILTYVVDELSRANISRVTRDLGMPYFTVFKIANGETKAPRIDTLQKLADYFDAKELEKASK